MLYKEYILALVHLKQEEGWQLDKATIIIHTNFFFKQWEQGLITLLFKEIDVISKAQQTDAKDLVEGIRNKKDY